MCRFNAVSTAATLVLTAAAAHAQTNGCGNLPGYVQLKAALVAATQTETSGLNNQMWGTIVDRDGVVCAVAFTGND